MSLILNEVEAAKIAELLLQIKAIVLDPKNPFTWASGKKSPIYCDNRKILSYPTIRNFVRKQLAEGIIEKYRKPDIIAGVATGGIAHGVLVAQDLNLPFVYVRSSAKAHGMENLIEGVVEEGQTVVVIEDLISTGGSSLKAVDALKEKGCIIKGMGAIFSYGFDEAKQAFEKANCPLFTLCDYEHLLKKAEKDNYISSSQIEMLSSWRKDPSNWMPH